jgi:glycosidase
MKTPSAFLAGFFLFLFACVSPAGAQAPAGGIRIHCASPYTHVWAWHGATNLFRAWPGAAMEEEGGFWRTCRFDGRTALSVVFSEDGRNQTRDLAVPGAGEWWFYRDNWHRENPFMRPRFSSRGGRESRERTWYQLLVYSFADGDGDGVGDFKGLVEHLDYLEALGIGGILLSPIHPADSYHGYDVKDYRAVNPAFEAGGTDFAALLRACHARGIKVLLDMVFNHTSANHPWRREHADWYNGEAVFGGWMPDLDYDNPAVRREIKDIGRFWLAKGVDGFRCDAATWIYGGGGSWQVESGIFARSVDWWREFAAAMREEKEDAYLAGEVWTELPWIERFFASGMGAFNFSAPFWVKDALEGENAAYWADETVRHQAHVRGGDADGIEAAFLSNHDLNRFAAFGKSDAELKFANALNVLAPGGSFVYYGDELGMTGSGGKWHDMTLRTSMPFAKGRTYTARFMDGAATDPGTSAEAQARDPRSVFAYTAKAIRLKNAHPTLYTGTAEKLETGSASCAALRVEDDRACCVLLVNAARNPAKVSVKGAYRIAGDLSTEGAVSVRGGDLVLPGLSLVLLEGDVSVRARNP